MKRATELEYLQYFFDAADFGPADQDIRDIINARFKKKTGLALPEGYDYDEEEDEDEDPYCPTCNGTGEGQYDGSRCYSCKGSGVERREED